MWRDKTMQGDDFRRFFLTTTVRPRFTVRPSPRPSDDIELDDQAPLALIICIALPIFIGFIILILIFCFCRRRPSRANNAQQQQNVAGSTAAYHRAPEAEGVGVGSYPMTAVPNSYPNTGYTPRGHMVAPPTSQGYRMVHPGMAPSPLPVYPSQQVPIPPPPHFGGVPATYPPPPPPPPPSTHQYPPSSHPIYLPPPSHPHAHSLSHSSQASSASATTVDPLVPSSPPQQHHHHLQHHQHFLQHQQQQQFFHQQQQQHQHQFQMQSISGSGRDSPLNHLRSGQFPSQPPPSSLSYPLVQSGDQTVPTTAQPNSDMYTSVTSSESTKMMQSPSSPTEVKSPSFLRKPPGSEQDLGYSDEEEE